VGVEISVVVSYMIPSHGDELRSVAAPLQEANNARRGTRYLSSFSEHCSIL
jgi:hypothetical protein